MAKLKALFKKLKPESPKSQAVLLTLVIFNLIILAIVGVVNNPTAFVAIVLVGVFFAAIGFFTWIIYSELLHALNKRSKLRK